MRLGLSRSSTASRQASVRAAFSTNLPGRMRIDNGLIEGDSCSSTKRHQRQQQQQYGCTSERMGVHCRPLAMDDILYILSYPACACQFHSLRVASRSSCPGSGLYMHEYAYASRSSLRGNQVLLSLRPTLQAARMR